jgi:hypothetical protein
MKPIKLFIEECAKSGQVILAGSLVFLGLLSAATGSATPPTPLLQYTFDDGSGAVNANDTGVPPPAVGLFSGSATRTSNTPNGSGYALDVTTAGVNDYVHCGDPAKLDNSTTLSNAVTLTAWVNLQAAAVAKDRFMSKISTTGGFDLYFNNSSATSVNLDFNVNTTSGGCFSSAINMSQQWVFVAVTYNATQTANNVLFYTGGTNTTATLLNTASLANGLIKNSTNEFRVGSTAASSSDRTPPAWIDDVRIYDSVLSPVDLETVRAQGGFPNPLTFIVQPSGATVYANTNLTLTATPNAAISFEQWYFNGTNLANALSGATNSTLILSNLNSGMTGTYSLFASNSSGVAWSSGAVVTVVPLFKTAQMTNIWNILPGDTNHFYITTTAGGERGLTFNPTTTNLLMVTHVPTNNLVVLDPATGNQKYFMNVGGIATNGAAINMVGVAGDGAVYSGNVVANAGSASTPYMLWQWADDSTNTTADLLFDGDPGYGTAAAGLRWGDSFAVCGAGSSTEILIAPGATATGAGTNVVLFTTLDGLNFSPTVIGIAGVPSGFGQGGVAFGPGTNTLWAKDTGQQLYLVQFDPINATGAVLYAYGPSNNVPNTFQFISVNRSQNWLAGVMSVASGLPDNVRLYDVASLTNGPVLADLETNLTSNLNGFNGGVGVGSTAFGGNYLFSLDSQNGVRAFLLSTNVAPFNLASATPLAGPAVALTWQSLPGFTYQVQAAASLLNPLWSNAGTAVTASGATASATISTPGTNQFYRVLGQ